MILSSTLAPVLASLSARKVVTVELDWRDRSGPLFPELNFRPSEVRIFPNSSRSEPYVKPYSCTSLFRKPGQSPREDSLSSELVTPATISLVFFRERWHRDPTPLILFRSQAGLGIFSVSPSHGEQYYRGEWYHFFEPFHWHREFPRTKIWTPAEIPKGANSKEEASEEEV